MAPPSGFPIRALPLDVPGYAPQSGVGIQGEDFECSISIEPGVCALNSVLDAALMCAVLADCHAVAVFNNGGPPSPNID
jgi:hypothetical protein